VSDATATAGPGAAPGYETLFRPEEQMGRPGPASQAKRKREIAKQQKRKAKEERRALRKEQKAQNAEERADSEQDPDIAGIRPGRQDPIF
jgi:hypothetical protein